MQHHSRARLALAATLVPLVATLGAAVPAQATGPAPAGAPSGSSVGARALSPAVRAFTGTFYGHTRFLVVKRNHVGREWVDSGCCDHVVDLTLRLSHFHGNRERGWARAVVTSVHVADRSAFDGRPVPHVGQRGVLRVRHGVITEPFVGTNYCDARADNSGVCGA